MDLLKQLKSKLMEYFPYNGPPLQTPIPETNVLSQGQAYALANDQSRERAAHQRNLERYSKPTPTPISFKLNEEIANAPRKQVTPARNNYAPEPTIKPILNIGKATIKPASSTGGYKSNLKESIPWEDVMTYFQKEAPKRGYAWEALVKQKALESAFGTSQFARERNNFGGIGAYDSSPNSAFKFASLPEYFDYYDRMVKKRFPNAYKVRNDPKKYIEELKKAGYATDPDYVEKVMSTPLKRGS